QAPAHAGGAALRARVRIRIAEFLQAVKTLAAVEAFEFVDRHGWLGLAFFPLSVAARRRWAREASWCCPGRISIAGVAFHSSGRPARTPQKQRPLPRQ